MKTRHNPERRAWRGRSYKKNGRRIAALREPRLSSRDLGVCSHPHHGAVQPGARPSPYLQP